MRTRTTRVVVRSVYGTAAVEWFLILAIATIIEPPRVCRRLSNL